MPPTFTDPLGISGSVWPRRSSTWAGEQFRACCCSFDRALRGPVGGYFHLWDVNCRRRGRIGFEARQAGDTLDSRSIFPAVHHRSSVVDWRGFSFASPWRYNGATPLALMSSAVAKPRVRTGRQPVYCLFVPVCAEVVSQFDSGLTAEGVSQRSANAEHGSVAELSDTVGQH